LFILSYPIVTRPYPYSTLILGDDPTGPDRPYWRQPEQKEA